MLVVMLLPSYLLHRCFQIQFHFYISVRLDTDQTVLWSGSSQEGDLDLRVDQGREHRIMMVPESPVYHAILKIVQQKDYSNGQNNPSCLHPLIILAHLSIHPMAQNIPMMKMNRKPTGRKKLM